MVRTVKFHPCTYFRSAVLHSRYFHGRSQSWSFDKQLKKFRKSLLLLVIKLLDERRKSVLQHTNTEHNEYII